MDLSRDENGTWSVQVTEQEHADKLAYIPRLAEYLTAFDGLFEEAEHKDTFQFVLSLLGVRGQQAAGWDAFETTVNAIDATVRLHNETADRAAAAHLRLWIYGHIIEASEPYELVANLLDICGGGTFVVAQFPDRSGRPESPGAKMNSIEQRATRSGRPGVAAPFRLRWDRELRNSIFHSDYAFHGDEIRLVSIGQKRDRENWTPC